jgi:hypothetical protein
MKATIYSNILLLLFFRLSGQNLPARFINLPLQDYSKTIISDVDTNLKFCQFNLPKITDPYVKVYFSEFNCNQNIISLFDSIELEIETFKDLELITDFTFIDSALILLGSKNIVILNKSSKKQLIKNIGYHKILKAEHEIYFARNFSEPSKSVNNVLCKLVLNKNKYSISEYISTKRFTLENPLSIYNSIINFVTSNRKENMFYLNYWENTIYKIMLNSNTTEKFPFAKFNIPCIDSVTIERCLKNHRKYMLNSSMENLQAIENTLNSIPHITSIASISDNTIVLNVLNFAIEENFFSQLFILKLDSASIVSKEISFKLSKDKLYTKTHAPYYTFGKRVYTACNQYIVLSSSVDETKLSESFTIEAYQIARDSTQSVKSIILVEP